MNIGEKGREKEREKKRKCTCADGEVGKQVRPLKWDGEDVRRESGVSCRGFVDLLLEDR